MKMPPLDASILSLLAKHSGMPQKERKRLTAKLKSTKAKRLAQAVSKSIENASLRPATSIQRSAQSLLKSAEVNNRVAAIPLLSQRDRIS